MKILRLIIPFFLTAVSAFAQVNLQQPSSTGYLDNSVPRRQGTANKMEGTTVLVTDTNGINVPGSITTASLTSGRVPFASTAGLVVDNSAFTFNSGTGALTATSFAGAFTGNASTATALATVRTIGGSNFDGSANVTSFPAPGAIGGTTPAAITGTAIIGNTSVAGGFLASTNADVADAGAVRFGNAETIAWEASPAGTDATLTVNASEQFVFSNDMLSPTLITPALGTPSAIVLTNATGFPTLNQNTTGSAASLSISGQTGLLTVTGLTSTNRIKTVRDAADTLLELGGSYTPTGTWTNMPLTTPAATTSITTPSTTFALVNTTATTLNFAAAATTINMGNAAGTTNLLGTLSLNPGGSVAGTLVAGEGTAPSLVANSWSIYSPTDVAAGGLAYSLPAAAATGYLYATNTAGVMAITHVAGAGSLTSTYVGYGDGSNLLTGEAAFSYTAASNTINVDAIQLGATGVNITNDTDGAITFLGTSAGSDEDLTLNLDDTANTVTVSSSTGVTTLALGAIGVTSTGTSSIGPLVDAVDGTTPLNNLLSAYGAGTAYSLTNTAAAIDFGTTDPIKTLTQAGTYTIYAQVHLAYAGATVVAETATLTVRRTNDTAADLGQTIVIDLPASTTLTNSYGIVTLPPFEYTTAVTTNILTINANVSAALGAGTINAVAGGTSIVAIRRY